MEISEMNIVRKNQRQHLLWKMCVWCVVSMESAILMADWNVPSQECFPVSDDFVVEARTRSGLLARLPVRRILAGAGYIHHHAFPVDFTHEFGGIKSGVRMVPASLCEFEFEDAVEIRISERGKEKPTSVLHWDCPCRTLIPYHGSYPRGLSLIAKRKPVCAAEGRYAHVVRFAAGYHNHVNDARIKLDAYDAPVVRIKSDDTLVVLEPGARVCASFEIVGASRVELCGGGTIDLAMRLPYATSNFTNVTMWGGFRENALPAVFIHGCAKDVVVRDLTIIADFRGLTVRATHNLKVEDVRIFTSVTNGDGVNMSASENVECRRLYIRSQDDCFCAYNASDDKHWLWDGDVARGYAMRNVKLFDSFLASDCRAFVFGGHGIRGVRGAPNVVENVEISNCQILGNIREDDVLNDNPKHQSYWSGIFRILSQSDELIRNVKFHDCKVEWVKGYYGQDFHVEVRGDDASYGESPGWKIENVVFRNIHFTGAWKDRIPRLLKAPRNDLLFNVLFDNITYK